MQEVVCLSCGSRKILDGSILGAQGSASQFAVPVPVMGLGSICIAFTPLMTPRFHACMVCGLVWSAIRPDGVREGMRQSPSEIIRQQIDELDFGPYRDLPDTELGRRIGDQISELDTLCRAGSPSLVRRYREMRGVTWGEALRETPRWRQMTRGEKLELFGWVAKKKTVKDHWDEWF